MLTLVLTRHGATARSEPEQHLGQRIDIGVSDAGREAAAHLARRLEGVTFDAVLSSPLKRAMDTAAIVAAGRAAEVDPRLAEMDYGRWEGLTYAEIDATDAEYRARWVQDPARLACPDGESGDQVAARVRAAVADLVGRSPDGATVLVVAHSTTNRILLCTALDVPIVRFRQRFKQDPANLTVLRFSGDAHRGALLLLCNDVSHLRGTTGATWA